MLSLLAAAEGKVDAGKVLEVILACRIALIPKAGHQVVDFKRTNLHMLRKCIVEAAPKLHGEGVIAAVAADARASLILNALDKSGIAIGMRRTKQRFAEGLEFPRMLLDLRAKHVREHVSAGGSAHVEALLLK